MKKLVFALGMCLVLAKVASAAPFVVCDVQDGVETYTLTLDTSKETGIAVRVGWIVASTGKIVFTDPGPVAKTPVHVIKDLANAQTGPHTIKGSACTMWGCSDDSIPFTFTKYIPGAPTSILLVNP